MVLKKGEKGLSVLEVVGVLALSGMCMMCWLPFFIRLSSNYAVEQLARQQRVALRLGISFLQEEVRLASCVEVYLVGEMEASIVAGDKAKEGKLAKVVLYDRGIAAQDLRNKRSLQMQQDTIGEGATFSYYASGTSVVITDQIEEIWVAYQPDKKQLVVEGRAGNSTFTRPIDMAHKIVK